MNEIMLKLVSGLRNNVVTTAKISEFLNDLEQQSMHWGRYQNSYEEFLFLDIGLTIELHRSNEETNEICWAYHFGPDNLCCHDLTLIELFHHLTKLLKVK